MTIQTKNILFQKVLLVMVALGFGIGLTIVRNRHLHDHDPIQLFVGITDKVMVVFTNSPVQSSENPGYTYKGLFGGSDDYLGRMLVVLPTTSFPITVEPKMVKPGIWVDAASDGIWDWQNIVHIGKSDVAIEITITARYGAKKKEFVHQKFLCRSEKINGLWNNTLMGAQFACLPKN